MTETHDRTFRHRRSLASPYVELRRVAASRVADVSPFVDQLMRFMRLLFDKFGDADESEAIEIALTEALANAVIHGNHESPDKAVVVICRCAMDGDVSITIRDEGEGFDSRSLPDPTDPKCLLLNHGRGIYLMRTLMDEVRFEEGGRVVRMRKSLGSPVLRGARHITDTAKIAHEASPLGIDRELSSHSRGAEVAGVHASAAASTP
ncbi:MAG: ATP-binding protein [Bryobacteraceae bacterium]